MVVSDEDLSLSMVDGDGDSSGTDEVFVVVGDGCGLGVSLSLTGVGGMTTRDGESIKAYAREEEGGRWRSERRSVGEKRE